MYMLIKFVLKKMVFKITMIVTNKSTKKYKIAKIEDAYEGITPSFITNI